MKPVKPLRQYFDKEFAPVRLANAHTQTRYQYDLNLRRFDEFLGRAATLKDLTDANVMGCVAWLQKEKQLSLATAGKLRDNMVTLWEFLAKRGHVKRWPECPTIQEPENPPVALPVAKLRLIWDIVSRQPGEICGIPESLWMRTLLATLWSTGERISPFWSATWAEFDLEAGFWTVPAKHRKGGRRAAVYPLHPVTIKLLSEIRSYGNQKVWPRDFSEGTLYNRLASVMVACGLPDDRQYKFHIFRKSVATMVELFGGNSVDVMGWRDPSMRDHYVDRKIAPKDSAAKRLPWIFSGDDQSGDGELRLRPEAS